MQGPLQITLCLLYHYMCVLQTLAAMVRQTQRIGIRSYKLYEEQNQVNATYAGTINRPHSFRMWEVGEHSVDFFQIFT